MHKKYWMAKDRCMTCVQTSKDENLRAEFIISVNITLKVNLH